MDIYNILSLSFGAVAFLITIIIGLFAWTAKDKITAQTQAIRDIETRSEDRDKVLKEDINQLTAKYDRLDIELRSQQNEKYEKIMEAIGAIDSKISVLQTEVTHLKNQQSQ